MNDPGPIRAFVEAAPSAPPAAAPASRFEARVCARPLLIAVPLYRRPDLAVRVAESLLACAAEIAALRGEVVLYDDSPEDPDLAETLTGLAARLRAALPCRVEANPLNLGFVRTANRAFDEAAARGFDVVLLNSDAVLTPGALTEMAAVAREDPMIGFVNPRSNNATLATLPFQERFRHLPPEPARRAWAAVADRLPRYSYAPTANGFCVLVRWFVLAEFGGFDEIYGRGYNEENDLAMRAGRRGYRAVLANRAFVWHEGSASFATEGEALELRNRAILDRRYPEYGALAEGYFRSPEQRAEQLLGALIADADGRLDVALDFSSFVAAHNGTFEAGVQLLAAAARAWRDRFNLFVLCAPDAYAFHGLERHGVERRDPHGPESYAAIFRVGQPYEPGAIERLVLKGAAIGVFMLDTISLDCTQLADPELQRLWGFTLEHADLIATTSALTAGQLERRFAFGEDTLRVRSLHSLDLADYRLPVGAREGLPEPGYVFVVGNGYAHKDVARAVKALLDGDPSWRIVVLAGEEADAAEALADAGAFAPRGLPASPRVVRVPAGRMAPERMGALYAGAAVVVFPSHYEGFGIPVLNALAARRPVVVRALPVFDEIAEALGGEANLHVALTTADLVAALSPPPVWTDAGASRGRPGDAARAAEDIGEALERAIARADYGRIVRRIRHRPSTSPPPTAPATPQAFVADAVARRVGAVTEALLALPGAFPLLRAVVRGARAAVAPFRRRPTASG